MYCWSSAQLVTPYFSIWTLEATMQLMECTSTSTHSNSVLKSMEVLPSMSWM